VLAHIEKRQEVCIKSISVFVNVHDEILANSSYFVNSGLLMALLTALELPGHLAGMDMQHHAAYHTRTREARRFAIWLSKRQAWPPLHPLILQQRRRPTVVPQP